MEVSWPHSFALAAVHFSAIGLSSLVGCALTSRVVRSFGEVSQPMTAITLHRRLGLVRPAGLFGSPNWLVRFTVAAAPCAWFVHDRITVLSKLDGGLSSSALARSLPDASYLRDGLGTRLAV